MERRDFLKLALGFVAVAGATTATAAGAATALPSADDARKPMDSANAGRAEAEKLEREAAAPDGDLAEAGDTDLSARRWWHRRRHWWHRRRRRWWRRRRRLYFRHRRRWWRHRRRRWRHRRVIYW